MADKSEPLEREQMESILRDALEFWNTAIELDLQLGTPASFQAVERAAEKIYEMRRFLSPTSHTDAESGRDGA